MWIKTIYSQLTYVNQTELSKRFNNRGKTTNQEKQKSIYFKSLADMEDNEMSPKQVKRWDKGIGYWKRAIPRST